MTLGLPIAYPIAQARRLEREPDIGYPIGYGSDFVAPIEAPTELTTTTPCSCHELTRRYARAGANS